MHHLILLPSQHIYRTCFGLGLCLLTCFSFFVSVSWGVSFFLSRFLLFVSSAIGFLFAGLSNVDGTAREQASKLLRRMKAMVQYLQEQNRELMALIPPQESVPAPASPVALVHLEVEGVSTLWQEYTEVMGQVLSELVSCTRACAVKHQCYESMVDGDVMLFACQDPLRAVEFMCQLQKQLMQVRWPSTLTQHPLAAEKREKSTGRVLFRGPRVRMCMHFGETSRLSCILFLFIACCFRRWSIFYV